MMRKRLLGGVLGLGLAMLAGAAGAEAATPLRIGYSDWPGWIAWQVAIDKGWFKQAGVDVDFQWFDYSASMDAFNAGKLDADCMTNGDTLVNASSGIKSIMIMLTDYSDGNDMIVAKPPYRTLQSLKGQKIGIEVGLVEHLLLLYGLQHSGMSEADVTLVNAKTNETPQVLASGAVAAIGAWQPNAGMAMQMVPGAHPVYTSANAPGLIYDVLAVSPTSLKDRRADWMKVIEVWNKTVAYINDPKTQPEAVAIMARRVGLTPAQYLPLLKGTHLIDVAEGKKVFEKGPGLNSLYGSSKISDDFNVKNGVYKAPQDIDGEIDPSLTEAQP